MAITYEAVSKDIVKKITTTEELIDLGKLKEEKSNLEEMMDVRKPTEEELIEQGKSLDPYYQDTTWMTDRIKEIDSLLGVK